MTFTLELKGLLKGHNGWVTSIAVPKIEDDNTIVTGSRDKTLIIWKLNFDSAEPYAIGEPFKQLTGHSHSIQDVALSIDAQFALSASWDHTVRLWDMYEGVRNQTFVGHTKDVMSVAFSADNRQIVSASRDKTVKVWNTLGQCKFNFETDGWVTSVRFSPSGDEPFFVSGGCDKTVRVFDAHQFKEKTILAGHTGYVNTVTVSPDGSLCASGGKDGLAHLWDINNQKLLYTLDAGDTINALAFSPNHYWLVASTNKGIKIWDLEQRNLITTLDKSTPGFFGESKKGFPGLPASPAAVSVAWSFDGKYLFAGFTDNVVRAWEVKESH